MAIDVTELTDYSWSDIAKAAKMAMMSGAIGGAELHFPDRRMIRRITMDEAKSLYNLAISMMNEESSTDTGGGIVLVNRGSAR